MPAAIEYVKAGQLHALAVTIASRSRARVFPPEQQTPEALAALQKADIDKWWPVIKELGIKAE
jgi:tripartite-type tricarboxylate transporter receptor subunit TctC